MTDAIVDEFRRLNERSGIRVEAGEEAVMEVPTQLHPIRWR